MSAWATVERRALDFEIPMVTEITKLIFLFQGLTVDLSIQISIRSGLVHVSHEEQIFRSKIEDATCMKVGVVVLRILSSGEVNPVRVSAMCACRQKKREAGV